MVWLVAAWATASSLIYIGRRAWSTGHHQAVSDGAPGVTSTQCAAEMLEQQPRRLGGFAPAQNCQHTLTCVAQPAGPELLLLLLPTAAISTLLVLLRPALMASQTLPLCLLLAPKIIIIANASLDLLREFGSPVREK